MEILDRMVLIAECEDVIVIGSLRAAGLNPEIQG